jgi:hypothetical protein
MSDPIEQPVMMTSPDGKESYKVVPDDIEYAKSQGWKPSEQFDKEQNFEKQVEGKNAPGFQEGDTLDTLADKFLGTATLGVAPIIENALDNRSPEVKAIVQARKERTEAEHPIASTAASGLGLAGSLLIPGPGAVGKAVTSAIGKAATANVAAKIGTAIAANTAIAETYNAPSQIANLVTGDPQAAAENLVHTAALGIILGPLSLGASKAITYFLDKAPPDAAKLVADTLMKNGGNRMKTLAELQSNPAIAKWLNSNPGAVTKMISDANTQIDDHKKQVDDQFNTLTKTDPAQVSDTVVDGAQKLGQANTSPINPTQPFVNPAHISNDFSADALKDTKIASDPMYAQVKGVFGDAGSNMITHESADALRDNLNSLEDHPLKNLALKKLDDTQGRSLDAGMQQIGGEDLIKYNAAKQNLTTGEMLQELKLAPGEAQTSETSPLMKFAISAGLVATGHPYLAVANQLGMIDSKALLGRVGTKLSIPINELSKLFNETPNLFGGSLARSVNEAMDGQIEKIPSILGGTFTPATRRDPLTSLIGNTSGLSKDQQYNRITSSIINSQANPESISENYGQLLALFSADPHLQNLIAQHNTNALSYLNSILPKDPNPPQAFSKNDWQPTKAQKADFLSQLAIVDNPMLAVHKIADGSITLKDMATLKTVYPALTDKILGKVNQYAFSPEAVSASPGKRIAIAKATGTQLPLLNPTNVSRNQSTFSQAPPQQNPNGSPPNPRHTNTSLKGGPSYQTEAGRLQYKGVN